MLGPAITHHMKFTYKNLIITGVPGRYEIVWFENRVYAGVGTADSLQKAMEDAIENSSQKPSLQEVLKQVKTLAEQNNWDFQALCDAGQ